MRYLITVKGPELAAPPPQGLMDAMNDLTQEAIRAGHFVQAGGLAPTAKGTRLRSARGKVSVTDGPFSESKEVVGGFALFDFPSHEEAMAWTRRFMELHAIHWPEWEGEAELRQIVDRM